MRELRQCGTLRSARGSYRLLWRISLCMDGIQRGSCTTGLPREGKRDKKRAGGYATTRSPLLHSLRYVYVANGPARVCRCLIKKHNVIPSRINCTCIHDTAVSFGKDVLRHALKWGIHHGFVCGTDRQENLVSEKLGVNIR